MKAYAYIRVSSLSQVEGTGMDRQIKAVYGYAAKADIEITKVFNEEGMSGTVEYDERPVFKEMLAEILQNGVKTVIVERLDRLARNIGVQQNILTFLILKGISLISADTGENITEAVSSDPMRKALVAMQGIFAELEKDMLVAKLRKARKTKKEKNGKCEGPKHYGEDDEAEQDIVGQILLLRAQHHPLRWIADTLNSAGHKTKRGSTWTATQVWRVVNRAGKN